MTRQIIVDLIKKNILFLQKEGIFPKFVVPQISVERAAAPEFGDFASNIAIKMAVPARQNPFEIANAIKGKIDTDKKAKKILKSIEVAGPGFVNFRILDDYWQGRVGDILNEGTSYGGSRTGRGRKVQVEFISANPTGPMHLGNGRGGAIGNALANVLRFCGYKVEKEYYVNDRGNQVKMLGASTAAGREFLKEHRLEENAYQGRYIKEWEKKNHKLVERYRNDLGALGERMARDFLRDFIKPVVKKFGIRFDKWFSERSLYEGGTVKKILKTLREESLLYEKDGALWFRAHDFGDSEDRVLVKSGGEMTYFLSDLAYHWNKFKVRKFSRVIDIWGADHYGYVGRLKGGLAALGIEEENLDVIIMQLVRLIEDGKEIRMSKRAGTFVTLDELIDEIGADVAKFFFLMSSAVSHLDFDLKLAKERSEKNPVYYVQYANARIHSILAKSKLNPQKSKVKLEIQNFNLLNHPSELALIKELDRFPELVSDISRTYEVHKLTHFAVGLAKLFHAFYRDCRVIGEEKPLFEARLGLILATRIVLENLLGLIGVSAPEKM